MSYLPVRYVASIVLPGLHSMFLQNLHSVVPAEFPVLPAQPVRHLPNAVPRLRQYSPEEIHLLKTINAGALYNKGIHPCSWPVLSHHWPLSWFPVVCGSHPHAPVHFEKASIAEFAPQSYHIPVSPGGRRPFVSFFSHFVAVQHVSIHVLRVFYQFPFLENTVRY